MKKWLIVILAVAFFARIYNLNYNTAFLDEAQYITEGLKILSGDIESGIGGISWIGGSPFMYPLTSAAFYTLGGLMGSRFFMVLLGTVCVYAIYQFTTQLLFFRDKKMNQWAGLIAAAFMSVTTIAVISSRLAIYDGLAFTLFLLGVVIFHKAIYTGEPKLYLFSSIAFFLAFLSKYIVVIFFPFILLVPLLLTIKMKNMKGLVGIVMYFCAPFLFLTGYYVTTNFSALSEFIVNQGVVSKASYFGIFTLFWEYTGVTYVFCLLGLPFLWKHDRPLVLILLFFSTLPFLVHGLMGNDSSIQQHTFLSLVFALPVLGAVFAALIKLRKKLGIALTVFALGVQIIFTMSQVQAAETFWPNLTAAANVLKTTMQQHDRILAESGDSLYLEIQNKIAHEQLDGPFVFEYGGKEGRDAYVDAIKNGYFQYIQLDGIFFSEEDIQAIEEAMSERYKKVFDDGKVRVFRLNY